MVTDEMRFLSSVTLSVNNFEYGCSSLKQSLTCDSRWPERPQPLPTPTIHSQTTTVHPRITAVHLRLGWLWPGGCASSAGRRR